MPCRFEQEQFCLPNNNYHDDWEQTVRLPKEPCFYPSYADIPQRDLSVHFYRDGPVSVTVLAYSFALLAQNLDLSVKVKAYIEAQHGVKTPDHYGSISPRNYFGELDCFMAQARKKLNSPCIPSISGTFDVYVHSPQSTLGEPLPRFVIPMVDLEIISTGPKLEDLQRDLRTSSKILKENKFSGFLLRSGDIGKGGYQYMADFAIPFNPGFWETMGLFMAILVDTNYSDPIAKQNISNSQSLGHKFLGAQSLAEAHVIAREISQTFPSIPSGETRPGLLFDPRWIYHKLEAGNNCLIRPTPAKDYKNPPQLVGEIF